MRPKVVVSSLLLLVLSAGPAFGQVKKPLTNDDVLQMIKAGFDEVTIVKAIQANEPNFDTSVDALVALKTAGASKPIIDMILETEAKKKNPAPQSALAASVQSDETVPGLPLNQGAYYKGPAGWIQLQDAPKADIKTKGVFLVNVVPGTSMKTKYVFHGKQAPVQITENTPEFYLRDISKWGRDLNIVVFEVKKDTRELRGASMSMFGVKNGSDHESAIVVTRLSEHILKVSPRLALKNGEYLLDTAEGRGYDFGINVSK